MIISTRKIERINNIIKSFTDEDNEIIAEKFDDIYQKRNPLHEAIQKCCPEEFTKAACELLIQSSNDYDDVLDHAFYDALLIRVRMEWAIEKLLIDDECPYEDYERFLIDRASI